MSESTSEMLLHQYAQDVTTGWKSYPLRILGPRLSNCEGMPCSGQPTLIVQSMDGGFVSANCSICGSKDRLSATEFLNLPVWVSCPLCHRRMQPEILSAVRDNRRLAGNYGYACSGCKRYVLLAHLVPSWYEQFGTK